MGMVALAGIPMVYGIGKSASVWQRRVTPEGEHWSCRGRVDQIMSAMSELQAVAQGPVKFDQGNIGRTMVGGKVVTIEISCRV